MYKQKNALTKRNRERRREIKKERQRKRSMREQRSDKICTNENMHRPRVREICRKRKGWVERERGV